MSSNDDSSISSYRGLRAPSNSTVMVTAVQTMPNNVVEDMSWCVVRSPCTGVLSQSL